MCCLFSVLHSLHSSPFLHVFMVRQDQGCSHLIKGAWYELVVGLKGCHVYCWATLCVQELELRWKEYYELVTILLQWIRHHVVIFEERKFPASYEEIEVRLYTYMYIALPKYVCMYVCMCILYIYIYKMLYKSVCTASRSLKMVMWLCWQFMVSLVIKALVKRPSEIALCGTLAYESSHCCDWVSESCYSI